MSEYTRRQRQWLDMRYRRGLEDGTYMPYGFLWGLDRLPQMEARLKAPWRYALSLQLLRLIGRLSPASLLDVGCSEGTLIHTVRNLYGTGAIGCDLSFEAAHRAREFLGVTTITAEADLLPFADDSFDVVVFTEVMEHIERPLEALAECARVAKRAFIFTTQQMEAPFVRALHQRAVNHADCHTECNFFTRGDFELLFGESLVLIPQGSHPIAARTQLPCASEAESIAAIVRVADDPSAARESFGVIGIVCKDPEVRALLHTACPRTDEEILRALFAPKMSEASLAGTTPPVEAILPRLRCPVTLKPLTVVEDGSGKALKAEGGGSYAVSPVGVPDFAVFRDVDRRRNALRLHARSQDQGARLEQLRAYLDDAHPWGGWRTHLVTWSVEAFAQWRDALTPKRKVKAAARSVLSLLRATTDSLLGGGEANEWAPEPLTCDHATGAHTWRFDVSNIRGATQAIIEVSDRGVSLTPTRLLTGERGWLSINATVRSAETVPARFVFHAPGEYQVRLLAAGRYGRIVGGSKRIITLNVT